MKAGLLVVTVMVVYTLLLYFMLTGCHQYAPGELRHVKCAPVTVRKTGRCTWQTHRKEVVTMAQTFNGRPLDSYDKPDLIRIVELEREAHIRLLAEMQDRLDSIRLATRLVLNQERR